MTAGTLQRYFAMRFVGAVAAVFAFVFVLVAMIDYIELMRRTAGVPNVSALLVAQTSFFRVPQITERIMPFAVLIGGMVCYLSLSRRLELVVARAAGVSVWQFIAPAVFVALVFGVLATVVYNPLSATLDEQAKRLETRIFGEKGGGSQFTSGGTFWLSQRTKDGHSILNATTSLQQGVMLGGVTALRFNAEGQFRERIEATRADLETGHWRLQDARVYAIGNPPQGPGEYLLETSLTPEQVRESFATPETVPFWNLPGYIERAERTGSASAAYRVQYYKLLARPFLLASMVFLAAAVSLRFHRFGGVQKMVLIGVLAGFLLYVMSKVVDDMSKADLLHPLAAALLPVLVGGLTGFVSLLYQEDG
ncbi:MAG: LPS export ABC transporter permease LptG [Rhizobiales bacterium]|nr:LPS export ABC transporter permease LptG [Hyphomicrobiales bacterium]